MNQPTNIDAALRAARGLAAPAIRQGMQVVAVHPYLTRSGSPSHWRIRCRHPETGEKWIRPMHISNGRFVMGEPNFPPGAKPIYRLHEIMSACPEITVFVVEGESCADALAEIGILATTSGSASSAADVDWSPLAGRKCVVWPDNDEAGRAYSIHVSEALLRIGSDADVVDVLALSLGHKQDCVDWLRANPGVSSADVLALPIVRAPERARVPLVDLVCASDIAIIPINWLWPGWLARGKLHVLAGAPGTGKTTIAIHFAAVASSGGAWPDQVRARPGNIIVWSGEDDPGDTLVPRLHAAGADLSRVYFVGDVDEGDGRRPFDPAIDIPRLEAEAARIGDIALLIVDPVVSAVAGDSHRNGEVRRALQPLVDLATQLGAAVLGISHFSKSSAGRDPIERVTGSIAFGALARVVLVTANDETNEEGTSRLLARAKSNIGPDGGGFRYSLEQIDVRGVEASRVIWAGAVEGKARELLNSAESDQGQQRSAREEAQDWLLEQLRGGACPTKELEAAAAKTGIAWRTIERAKADLGVITDKASFRGVWAWKLPEKREVRQRRQDIGVGESGGLDGLRTEPGATSGVRVAAYDDLQPSLTELTLETRE